MIGPFRRRRALERAVTELHSAIVEGPDGCGALDSYPMPVEAYIADPEAAAAAAPHGVVVNGPHLPARTRAGQIWHRRKYADGRGAPPRDSA